VIEAGGELSNRSYIEPTAFYESDDPDDDELRLLEVRNHLILFPSQGVFVDATLVVNADMEQTFYEYHHAIIGGRMIWRACKNIGWNNCSRQPTST